MIETDKKFKELGFKKETLYYEKHNLEIIKAVRYVKQTKEGTFEITFNLFGEYKNQIDMLVYTKDSITLPTPSLELANLITRKKEELGLQ